VHAVTFPKASFRWTGFFQPPYPGVVFLQKPPGPNLGGRLVFKLRVFSSVPPTPLTQFLPRIACVPIGHTEPSSSGGLLWEQFSSLRCPVSFIRFSLTSCFRLTARSPRHAASLSPPGQKNSTFIDDQGRLLFTPPLTLSVIAIGFFFFSSWAGKMIT